MSDSAAAVTPEPTAFSTIRDLLTLYSKTVETEAVPVIREHIRDTINSVLTHYRSNLSLVSEQYAKLLHDIGTRHINVVQEMASRHAGEITRLQLEIQHLRQQLKSTATPSSTNDKSGSSSSKMPTSSSPCLAQRAQKTTIVSGTHVCI